MAFGAIMLFRDNFEDDLSKVNLAVLFFAPAAYILSLIAGIDFIAEYIHYLFIGAMGWYGWTYLKGGLDGKNPFSVMLGGMAVLSVLPLIYAQFPYDIWQEQGMVGILITLYGLSMIAISVYLRREWSVTDEKPEYTKGIDLRSEE